MSAIESIIWVVKFCVTEKVPVRKMMGKHALWENGRSGCQKGNVQKFYNCMPFQTYVRLFVAFCFNIAPVFKRMKELTRWKIVILGSWRSDEETIKRVIVINFHGNKRSDVASFTNYRYVSLHCFQSFFLFDSMTWTEIWGFLIPWPCAYRCPKDWKRSI